jgi:hypothetical protein
LYYRSHFDIHTFKLNHEGYIREVYIKGFVSKSDHHILYPYIYDMMIDYREYVSKIVINRNFPRDELVKIMRPYLELYLLSKYLITGSERKFRVDSLLKRKLYKFSSCNPDFGKKIVSFVPKESNCKRLQKTIEYNKECVNFFDNSKEPFRVNWSKFDNLHYRFHVIDSDDNSYEDDDEEDGFDP